MTTKARRTPEQIAAYYQGKANAARAAAAKMKKKEDARAQDLLVKAALFLFNTSVPGQDVEGLNLLAMSAGRSMSDEEWEFFTGWWQKKGYLDGGYTDRKKQEAPQG